MRIVDINQRVREGEKFYLDPQYPGFVSVIYRSKNRSGQTHTEWYPLEEFKRNNPKAYEELGSPPSLPASDLGTVTHAGEFYLEDIKKEWRNNIFAGFTVWIARGTGEGQTRLVKSNTKNMLTIETAWVVLPDEKSQYVVSQDVHDVKILGNSLPQFSL